MLIHELETKYDPRKSFYRKAIEIYHGLNVSLVSYDTVICTINKNGKLVMNRDLNDMSTTTKRHFREFIKQHRLRLRIEE